LYFHLAGEDDLTAGQGIAAAMMPIVLALMPKPML